MGVILNCGSGLSLLAFVLERKKAVGIMKNKAHKDFVMQNLKQHVKTLGIAPDKRPPKPAALKAWEAQRVAPPGVRGGLPPFQQSNPAPDPPAPSQTQPAPSEPAPPAPSQTSPGLAQFGNSALR